MPTLYIDNKPYDISTGKNLLETCLTLGFDLPYFCWHPALGSVGACRQCAVKIYKDENDSKGRIIMSCMEPVGNNQRISVNDVDAKDFRAMVIEWLMTNHPHDCAVCDEGGSCHLQDMTVMTGHNYRNFRFKKRTHTNQYLGPFINHEMNRCIQCYRCVRFYKDYAGGTDLDVFASRNNVYFGRAEEGTLESEFSGNLSEVCPTGVFTDKTLKEHYTRKWDLTMAPTICQHCSLGCNIIGGERYGQLRMIANRYHGEINGYFICDRGRFGYEFVNADTRIKQPLLNGQVVDEAKVLHELSRALKKAKVIGIGSPRASIQSNFALKTLVGSDNFFHGVSDNEHDLAKLAIQIMKDGPAIISSMKDVEKADAIFILGEDLTNTAPMMALAVRQSARQQPMEELPNVSIPKWHDAAVREFAQESKSPIYIATVTATKLDDVAAKTYQGAPHDIARLGFAVAHILDNSVSDADGLPDDLKKLAKEIAEKLSQAKNPVIISGASCQSRRLMQSAANVVWALNQKNKKAGIVLTMPECNSIGLALMGGHRLNGAFNAVVNGHADTVIVMENDLFRHGNEKIVNNFIKHCKTLIVLDHTQHATSKKSSFVIPAGTFAESDGIVVNNEGRAQRHYQVYEPVSTIKESWRWLIDIGSNAGNQSMMEWKNFEDITKAISTEESFLKGVDTVSLSPSFRMPGGQRIPRAPHRYSGRTAILANINVNEPKPPDDPDSPLSYTMEGSRELPPPAAIPFFWSPGWNSVQSVNKYQEEVGASLRGGDPGIRLLQPSANGIIKYFEGAPEPFKPSAGHLLIVAIHHIFGSDEQSAQSKSVLQRIPKPYGMVNAADAQNLKLKEGANLNFEIDKHIYSLPVKISQDIPTGVGGIPYGLISCSELPTWGILKT